MNTNLATPITLRTMEQAEATKQMFSIECAWKTSRRQAIVWTNAGILFILALGANFNEILIEIHTFSSKKMHLKTLSGKWPPFWLGPNVFIIFYDKTIMSWTNTFNPEQNVLHIMDDNSNRIFDTKQRWYFDSIFAAVNLFLWYNLQ